MDILPAIDLRDGKVVRLMQGDYDRRTTYADNPGGVAETLTAAGAQWIHVVDLEAARTGLITNLPALRAIISASGGRIEFGGGVRDEKTVDTLLGEGVGRLVIGSAAMEDWKWFERLCRRADLEGKLALGLDARDGRLAIHGWTRQVRATAQEIARRVNGWPLGAIIYTDISRDGMLSGVNRQATAGVAAATDVGVIASGGVASMDDIIACYEIGCAGVIIGRAMYEGQIDLAEVCKIAAELSSSRDDS